MSKHTNTKLFKCAVCGKEICSQGRGVHIKTHGITSKEYKERFEINKIEKRVCVVCGKVLDKILHPNTKFCSEICREQEKINKNNKKFENIPDIPVCKICGWKSTALHAHITQKHRMSLEEYKQQFNITDKKEIYHKSYIEELSEKWSGSKNPGYQHGGKFSPFSSKSIYHTEEQRKIAKEKAEANRSYNTRLDYWLERTNGNKEIAKKLLSYRQATGSLEKFIERYGEEEGRKRWKHKINKWQNTLNSKPDEEKEDINRRKLFKKGYSKVSQELFWELYEHIKSDFRQIYFATLDCDKEKEFGTYNNEFAVKRKDGKLAFLDFYIKDLNKAIEFDGAYWHQEKNKEKDIIREYNILMENPEMKILHIREEEYSYSAKDTIQKCLNFIYSK